MFQIINADFRTVIILLNSMINTNSMTKITGLVLQGGGALGAYQYGALKGFYEVNPNFNPEIVTGTSIGSINGAVMLGGKYGAIKSLKKLWDALKIPSIPLIPQEWQAKTSKFGNPNMYYVNPAIMLSPLTADSIYNLSPFRKLLLDIIDFDKLNDKKTSKLVIETVNVETGQLKQFSNRDEKGIDIDKLLACVSIPPNFPAMQVDNDYYWDGGLYANMPLSPAINFLEECEATEREVIVISLFRKNGVLPTSISEITDRIKEIIFESKLNLDRKSFDKMNNNILLIRQVKELLEQIEKDDSIKQSIKDEADKITKNSTFNNLLQHKEIDPLTILQYEAEGVEGTDDFTPQAVESRIRQGQRDAINSFTEVIKN